MRIEGNVEPRQVVWVAVPVHQLCHDLDGALIGQCQGEPAYWLTEGMLTDTRYVSIIVDSANWI